MVRALIVALVIAVMSASSPPSANAQIRPQTGADLRALETRLLQRFQILPIANGVVLTPRFRTTVRSVEITDRTIAVDGSTVTGAELRDKLGADADLIFQLSYLDAASRRSLLGLGSSAPTGSVEPAPAPAPAAEPAPTPVPAESAREERARSRHRDDIVKFGGSVKIDENETVSGDVAVIGGSASIEGEVTGDAVVVGGSMKLGPRANVHRDVTVVGGSLDRADGAIIGGKVTEVGLGDAILGGQERRAWRYGPWWGFTLTPYISFAGTLARVALVMLLAGIVLLVARMPVQQIADRAAAEPLKSWAIGFLAELLFGPVLVLTVIVLAVSIIGIPLLLLVPVAIVAGLVVSLVGFTGVAYHIGRTLEGRFDQLRERPYVSTLLGIVVIVSPLLLARVIGLIGGLGLVAGILLFAGIVVEYLAWTTGLGAAALVRFGRPLRMETAVVPSPQQANP